LRYAERVPFPRAALDAKLIQIVDAALADAARRAGEWLVCRPGCTRCCVGAFAINALDAARLGHGLRELRRADPPRADRVQQRAREYLARTTRHFPGDPETGVLSNQEIEQEAFAHFANDESCPALDPNTGTCDLYAYRPMTCRVFGPPVRTEGGGLGICELCYRGATDQQIASCEMKADPENLEQSILDEMPSKSENTIVAFVLAK
jgi:Fe-S-cluster containining protein